MNKLFTVGDVHGCKEELDMLLKSWCPDNEQLVFLGDYIDRGPDSLQVLERVRELSRQYGAVALGGNHEDLFLSFLESPDEEFVGYVRNGGWPTIKSLIPEELQDKNGKIIMDYLLNTHGDIIEFIKELPDYYESMGHVFVHAGVNPFLNDWKHTSPNDFRWIRDPFHYRENSYEETFVFGHTPTPHLNKDRSSDVWFSPCGRKIGIDGGLVFGGMLHGLSISETGEYRVFSQPKLSGVHA